MATDRARKYFRNSVRRERAGGRSGASGRLRLRLRRAIPHGAAASPRAVCRSVWSSVAAMAEPASGVGGGDRGEGARQLAIEVGDRAGFLGAQGGLDLGPAGLDRGQVGRVAREVAEAEAGGLG